VTFEGELPAKAQRLKVSKAQRLKGSKAQRLKGSKANDFCGAAGAFGANSAARHLNKNQLSKNQFSLQPLAAVVERIGKSCIGAKYVPAP
jgi:hypothetical protein